VLTDLQEGIGDGGWQTFGGFLTSPNVAVSEEDEDGVCSSPFILSVQMGSGYYWEFVDNCA